MYSQLDIDDNTLDIVKNGHPDKKVTVRYSNYILEISTGGILYNNKIYNKISTYSDRADDGITDRYYCILESNSPINALIQFNCEKDADNFDSIIDLIMIQFNIM